MPFEKVDGTIVSFSQLDSVDHYDYNLRFTPNGSEAYELSVQAAYLDQTPGNTTFIDGVLASGTVTITDFAAAHLTAATPSGTIDASVIVPGDTVIVTAASVHTFTAVAATPGTNEFVTADDLAALIGAVTGLDASNTLGTITITVTQKGTIPNSWTVTGTGTFTALSITFSGGIDAAIVTVAGHALVESTDWNSVTNNNTAADNLAAAIDSLSETQAANPAAAVITVKAATIGTAGNSITTTKSGSGITVQQALLSGGLNSAVNGTAHTITLVAHGMTTGLKVHYTVNAGTTLTNLVTNTDYYAILVDANTIKLATTLNNANNDTAIAIADANDAIGGGSFSLLAAVLSASIKLQCSNDGVNFMDVSGSSVSITASGNHVWDLGTPFYKILRVLITPAAGELAVVLTFNAINLS